MLELSWGEADLFFCAFEDFEDPSSSPPSRRAAPDTEVGRKATSAVKDGVPEEDSGEMESSSRPPRAAAGSSGSDEVPALPPARQADLADPPSHQVLRDPRYLFEIGGLSGLAAVRSFGAVAREEGMAMHSIFPHLYQAATPSVYVCGGASQFRSTLDIVVRYRTRECKWERLPPMCTSRRLCAAAVVGTSLYVFGGEDEEAWFSNTSRHYRQLAAVERYDTISNTWSRMEDMPTPRAGIAAIACAGLIYVVGGRVHDKVQPTAERFDAGIKRWDRLPPLRSARSGCAGASLRGSVYVVGGKGSKGSMLNSMERFDPGSGRWDEMPAMPMPRSAFACTASGNRLIVVCGSDGSEGTASVSTFDPCSNSWEEHPSTLTWRIGCAAASVAGQIFVLGGKTENDIRHTSEYFDPIDGRWHYLPPLKDRHVYCAAAAAVGD